jgi:hypothetical protein
MSASRMDGQGVARRCGWLRLAGLSAALCVGGLSVAVWASDVPQVPQTGQTKTYGPRDDGALRKGVPWPIPRFVPTVNRLDDTGIGAGVADNGICDGAEPCDGAVLDRLTGLTWLQNADCFGGKAWKDALASANQLASGQCGLNDGSTTGAWRLPNMNELRSLLDFGCASPAFPDRQGTGCYGAETKPAFANVQAAGLYWTSSVYAYYPSLARVVYLKDGFTTSYGRNSPLLVWPVRGGQ